MPALLWLTLHACAPVPGATWATLLDPPTELMPGWTADPPRRGHEHDVVLTLRGPSEQTVQLHVLDVGRWPDAVPAGPWAVDWEAPRTTAPPHVADALRASLAARLSASPRNLPPVEELPLGDEPPTASDRLLSALSRFGTRRPLHGLGLLVAALTAALVARASWRRDALTVGLIALSARLLLGAWGPFHANSQGHLWVAGALDPSLLTHYGPGFAELWGLVARLGPPDTTLFFANALLSSITCALAVGVGHHAGLSPGRALLAGLLLAVDPVSIRVATTESYLVPGAWLAAVVALTPTHRPLGLALTALAATLGARLHPTAWLPIASAPLLQPGVRPPLRAVLTAGVAALLTSGVVAADVLRAVSDGRLSPPDATVDPTRAALSAALIAATLWRARAWTPAVTAALSLDLLLRSSYAQSDLWQLAFDRLYALPVALGLAAVLPALLTETWPARAAVALLIALPQAHWITHRTIDDAEHTWAHAVYADTPPGCTLLYVTRTDPVVTVHLPVPPPTLTLQPLDARGHLDLAPLLPANGCVRYLRTSACSSLTGATPCARIEAQLRLTSLTQTSLPAVPSHRDVHYSAETLNVATFEVLR